jgi:hypothetical protein
VFAEVAPSDSDGVWSYDEDGHVLLTGNDRKFVVEDERGDFFVCDTENYEYPAGEDGCAAAFATVADANAEINDVACRNDLCASQFEIHHDDGREWFIDRIEDEDGNFDTYESGLRHGKKGHRVARRHHGPRPAADKNAGIGGIEAGAVPAIERVKFHD